MSLLFVGRNTSIVYFELPLLPRIWTIVILRPRGCEGVEQMDRQFRTASESAEQQDFTWNYDNLSQLPEDGNVVDQLNIHEAEESGEDREVVDEAAVPNMLIHDSELNQLQGRINDGVEADEQVPLQPVDP
ncbi:hypothetical protein N657DRAFT_650747 [Parathielavia appendiculata]|uniref:Uncharacterized protein n=1 Tax=Parathielavia appendiculata TaxID=2587402 RepID=A0AAN6YYM2_9PEZI|nr:hypothetical protein N657DRAFT_650747 [Parathielavia appendiculata]